MGVKYRNHVGRRVVLTDEKVTSCPWIMTHCGKTGMSEGAALPGTIKGETLHLCGLVAMGVALVAQRSTVHGTREPTAWSEAGVMIRKDLQYEVTYDEVLAINREIDDNVE